MARGFWVRSTHSLVVMVGLLTGCSVIGDFGAFKDEPDTSEGDGDGPLGGNNAQTTSDGLGDGDSASGGTVSGDGDDPSGGKNGGDGDTGGTMGDGDGDTGGTIGDGDGDTGSGGGGTGGSGSGGAASGGTGSGGNQSGSVGCGNADHPITGTFDIHAEGEARSYIIDVPDDYDPDQPYPLVFAFHALGETAADIADGGYFDLLAHANGSMIFVALQGINDTWYPNSDRDLNATTEVLDHLEAELCINTRHVFAVGFSAGAILVNSIGCSLGDRFSGIVPYSGALLGCSAGVQPVAFLGTHGGEKDAVVAQEARDEFRVRNGCSTATDDWGSNGCIQYLDCPARSPVFWCEFDGGHMVPSFAPEETWSFLSLMLQQ